MAHHILHLPAHAIESIREIQDQILRFELTPEEAQFEMERALAPYTNIMPQPGDHTEIRLARRIQVET